MIIRAIKSRKDICNSAYCICYLTKDSGGTAFTVKQIMYISKYKSFNSCVGVELLLGCVDAEDNAAIFGACPFLCNNVQI